MKLVVLQDSLSILQLNNVIGLQTSMGANNQETFCTFEGSPFCFISSLILGSELEDF